MTELERAYKQIDYLAQTLEITIKEKEALESQLSEAREALEKIKNLDPNKDSLEGHNEWGQAYCFCLSQLIAKEALAKLETPK